MNEYLICKVEYGHGISLCHGRRFAEEEKKGYAEWFKNKGFISTSDCVILEGLTHIDVNKILNDRPNDGSFNGTSNAEYIISEDEWNILVNLNNKKIKEKRKLEIKKEIEECEIAIERCEKQERLYTKEEAKAKWEKYNDLYNEGGEGYVPHFYTEDEYKYYKDRLKKLENNRSSTEV